MAQFASSPTSIHGRQRGEETPSLPVLSVRLLWEIGADLRLASTSARARVERLGDEWITGNCAEAYKLLYCPI